MTKDIRHTPRLFVEADLSAGSAVAIEGDQAHYLQNVLRMKPGEALRVFNSRDGEFLAQVGKAGKRNVELLPEKQLRPQTASGDIWLCAAPIKKAHFEYMIEKSTELGVSVFQPILTERTQIREVNTDRARSISIEAAEQSDRIDVPEIRKPLTLSNLLSAWPKDRTLIVCAEWGDAVPAAEAFGKTELKTDKTAILTGPEGGLSAVELEALRKVPGATFIRLGPRILRADTAALAALSLWQALCGDWGRD